VDRTSRLSLNRDIWSLVNSQFTDADAMQRWACDEITWGIYGNTEQQLGVLGDIRGSDVVELGCGTAYLSAQLSRNGACPVAVDLSSAQLATARRCQDHFDLRFPLIEANAESIPLANDSFDLVVSEHGASIWCDPNDWLPEAARVLRPGGRLVFMTTSPLATMCVPAHEGHAGEHLLRSPDETRQIHWDGGGVEFHPSHSDWIALLVANEFRVEALHELRAPPNASTPDYYDIATTQWAARWPVEDLWAAVFRN
jgi:SAM-dependent methyltransferase